MSTSVNLVLYLLTNLDKTVTANQDVHVKLLTNVKLVSRATRDWVPSQLGFSRSWTLFRFA